MNNSTPRARGMSFRPFRLLTVSCLLVFMVLVQLGQWQWTRYQEKRAAGARGVERVTLVSFTPIPDQIQLVYGVINGEAVWRVFVPVRAGERFTFLDVDAIPGTNPPDWRAIKPPFQGDAAIQGVPVHPHKPSPFAPAPNKDKHTWYAVDLPAMTKAVGGQFGPPYYVSVPYIGADGALKPNPYAEANSGDPLPPERHLGYAITWWGLAAALLVIYVIYHVRAGRLSFSRPRK
jgi:surfeit locus 1 family protein